MAAPFDFDFRKRRPDPPLGRFVESIWYARGTVPYTREKIAPTGSTVVVIVLGDAIIETADNGEGESIRTEIGFLVGPHDRPVINEPTGETFAVGVLCTPIGAGTALGLRPAAIRGRVLALDDVWSDVAGLRARLAAETDPDGFIDVVESHLIDRLEPAPPAIDRAERAVTLLEADPTRLIADIASDLGISHAHLDREFTAIVGITPRALARLLRMRRLLDQIEVGGDVDWAELAVDLGWYDQAHLIRDFKRHTGVTPTQYIEAQRTTLSPVEAGDAAGFVPQT